jgi:NaMN:DMB phosphoribosyltransferase
MQLFARVGAAALVIAGGFLAFRAYGWPGLALLAGGLMMWALLHMTRMLKVLQRAADRPIGTVSSAVMLHSRLSRGMTLLQVLSLTRALGQRLGDNLDAATERYQWTDSSNATVHCMFAHGKLAEWELVRA